MATPDGKSRKKKKNSQFSILTASSVPDAHVAALAAGVLRSATMTRAVVVARVVTQRLVLAMFAMSATILPAAIPSWNQDTIHDEWLIMKRSLVKFAYAGWSDTL